MLAITHYVVRERGKVDVHFADGLIETWNASDIWRFADEKLGEVEKWAIMSAIKDDLSLRPGVGEKQFVRESVVTKEGMTR